MAFKRKKTLFNCIAVSLFASIQVRASESNTSKVRSLGNIVLQAAVMKKKRIKKTKFGKHEKVRYSKWKKLVVELMRVVNKSKDQQHCERCKIEGESWLVGKQPEEVCRIIKRLNCIKAEQNPEAFNNVYIFHGPPGTGKTELAKLIAVKTKSIFIHTDGSRIINSYQGSGAVNIHKIFIKAAYAVNNQDPMSVDAMSSESLNSIIASGHIPVEEVPNDEKQTVVIFIDEVDAITKSRKETSHDSQHEALTALLTNLNRDTNIKSSNYKPINDSHVIVIFASNHPELIDSALRGRFVEVEVPLPDLHDCVEMFKKLLVKEGIVQDCNEFAERAHDSRLAYRDIKLIIDEAKGISQGGVIAKSVMLEKIKARAHGKVEEDQKRKAEEDDKEIQRKLLRLQLETAQENKENREFEREMQRVSAINNILQLRNLLKQMDREEREQEIQKLKDLLKETAPEMAYLLDNL